MRTLMLMALAALVGCSDGSGPGDRSGNYVVVLVNDGTVALRDVRVTTGSGVAPIVDAELAPGERTPGTGVGAVHETPIVSLVVNGRLMALQPVEGFDGFNALLPAGSYVVRLRYDAAMDALNVRVEPAVTG